LTVGFATRDHKKIKKNLSTKINFRNNKKIKRKSIKKSVEKIKIIIL